MNGSYKQSIEILEELSSMLEGLNCRNEKDDWAIFVLSVAVARLKIAREYGPRPAGAYVKQGREWQEYKCECPRCGRYCLAIIEDGETSHDCEHCDKTFSVNVGGN